MGSADEPEESGINGGPDAHQRRKGTSGSKILIVDDEMAISDTLALIFSTHGYEVRAAYSAEHAVEVIAVWEPDLAILDVMLPHMNGIDLGIAIKANYPNCRVLLFSGQSATGKLLEEATAKGHLFEILAKPAHPSAMLDTVSEMLLSRPDTGSSRPDTGSERLD